MTPSIFKKAKQRFNRSKAEPVDGIKPLPFSSPAPEVSATTIPEKPQITTKISKAATKPWQEGTVKTTYIPEDIKTITAGSTPQWLWPTSHCRAWLTAVFIKDLKLSPEKAAEIASGDFGIGANLYCRNLEYWIRVLGESDGRTVYARILGMREEEGAVPSFCHVRVRK